jgi:probable HAF family extracellular repeat protein
VATVKNGTLTQLGFAAGPRSINNSGAIVGSMSVGGGTVPFLYRDGVLHDVGTLGGNSGIAISINGAARSWASRRSRPASTCGRSSTRMAS